MRQNGVWRLLRQKASSWKIIILVRYLKECMLLCVILKLKLINFGIPLRTRHNEVAPAQFECAPIFEEVNLAVDHNTLLMDVMRRVAKRHNFVCCCTKNHLPELMETVSTTTGAWQPIQA